MRSWGELEGKLGEDAAPARPGKMMEQFLIDFFFFFLSRGGVSRALAAPQDVRGMDRNEE